MMKNAHGHPQLDTVAEFGTLLEAMGHLHNEAHLIVPNTPKQTQLDTVAEFGILLEAMGHLHNEAHLIVPSTSHKHYSAP